MNVNTNVVVQFNNICIQLGQAPKALSYDLNMNPPTMTVQHCNESMTIRALISVKNKCSNACTCNERKHQRHLVTISHKMKTPHYDSAALQFNAMRRSTKGN